MQKLELKDDYYELPPGKLANVGLHLDMKALPSRPLTPFPKDLTLEPAARGDLAAYRELFRKVGEEHLWFSRLVMSDEKLQETLADPGTESFTLKRANAVIGILELNFRDMPDCELAFFGLAPTEIGKGTGRALIDEAIRRAFARPIARFWLATCSFDHPKAVVFYQKAGFKAWRRFVQIHDDPRLQGKLPLKAAPQIPVLGS